MKVILASNNDDKVREYRQIMTDPPFQIQPMREAGFTADIEETGASFLENALIKAKAVHRHTGGLVVADDSGLVIDRLDGAPGVYSARFAGPDADYPTKINTLYGMLRPFPPQEWTARFVCVLAAVLPDGRIVSQQGSVDGLITPRPRGGGGFGYDPIFYVPDLGRTMAELSDADKHRISHRGKAIRGLVSQLLDRL